MSSQRSKVSLPRTQSSSATAKNTKPRQLDRARTASSSASAAGRPLHSTKAGKKAGEALRLKEERYRRLNEELEAKTATLVQEAEDLMRENLSFVSEDSIAVSSEEDEDAEPSVTDASQLVSTATERSPSQRDDGRERKRVKGERGRQQRAGKERIQEKDRDFQSSLTDDIERTVRELEEKLARENITDTHEEEGRRDHSYHLRMDDVVPEVAEDMGTEALMRFMKAKLRVLQEEVDRLSAENNTKDKQLSTAEGSLKEITEENTKLKQNHHSMQVQLTRYKQLSGDMQHKTEGLEAQLISLRREIDSMKAAHRKAASGHSAVEVRLNRATEEVERYKAELRKARTDSKDVSKQEKQRMEELLGENKRLESQKNELIAAFKKQMKLIDILKRQKLHVEAARMLSFTEEEFIKSLNWDTS